MDPKFQESLYQYQPLQDSPSYIRLLRIHRGQFEIIHVPLVDPPQYEAISYTWGDPTKRDLLNLSGALLPITANVYSILHELAPTFGTRCLWIDSICINQEDQIEKNRQVRLMRQIFKGATRVIAWLGHAFDAAVAHEFIHELGEHLMKQLSQRIPDQDNHMPFPNESSKWLAFKRLLCHSFWSRVWIVQEIAVARSVKLLYGGLFTDWDLFATTIAAFTAVGGGALVLTMETSCVDGVSFVNNLLELRNMLTQDEGIPLPRLLVQCCKSAATLPVDKVFALQGMSTAAEVSVLPPNYGLTVREVYTEATLDTLRCGSFSLFSLAGIHSDNLQEGLPSWVADLSRAPDLLSLDNLMSTYRAGGDGKPYFNSLHSSSIEIESVFTDEIREVTRSRPWHGLSSREIYNPNLSYEANMARIISHERLRHAELLQLAWRCLQDPYLNNQSLVEAVWRTVIGDDTGTSRPAEASIGRDYDLYLRSLGISWWGLQLTVPFEEPDIPLLSMATTISSPSWATTKVDKAAISRINRLMGSKMASRQFAVTKKGYMALVPWGTRVGDGVCIFSGARVPYVLRRISDGEKDYLLFGEAYVHGLMDGEAFRAGEEIQWFTLR